MSMAPVIRIVLRYGSGILAGLGIAGADNVGSMLAEDPDVIQLIEGGLVAGAATIGVVVERWYEKAKRNGEAT